MFILISNEDKKEVYGFTNKAEAEDWNKSEFDNKGKVMEINPNKEKVKGFGFGDVYIDIDAYAAFNSPYVAPDELLTFTDRELSLNGDKPFHWMDENHSYLALKDCGNYYVAYGSDFDWFDGGDGQYEIDVRREYNSGVL